MTTTEEKLLELLDGPYKERFLLKTQRIGDHSGGRRTLTVCLPVKATG